MIRIYKKTQVSHTHSAYLMVNDKNGQAIESLCTEDEIEKLKNILPCTEVSERPNNFTKLPKSEEEEFFINA